MSILTDAEIASLAEIERMIGALEGMSDAQRDKELARTYQVAIDRLDALAYRLANRPKPVLVGGTAAPETSRRVSPSIVIARNPRSRKEP